MKNNHVCNLCSTLVTLLSFNLVPPILHFSCYWVCSLDPILVAFYICFFLYIYFVVEYILVGFEVWTNLATFFVLSVGNCVENGGHLKEDLPSLWEHVCLLSCFEVKIKTTSQTLQKTSCWYFPKIPGSCVIVPFFNVFEFENRSNWM